jgi:hypothetical protein
MSGGGHPAQLAGIPARFQVIPDVVKHRPSVAILVAIGRSPWRENNNLLQTLRRGLEAHFSIASPSTITELRVF